MKKLTLFTIAGLALAGITHVSASSWNITNQLDRPVCVTVNTGVSQIRRHFEPGETRKISSKACLYSISVKEGEIEDQSLRGEEKGRCPAGLPNIAKSTVFQIDANEFDALKKRGIDILSKKQSANSTNNQASADTAVITKQKAAQSASQSSQAAGQALSAVMDVLKAVVKVCSNRDFIITNKVRGYEGTVMVITK